MNRPFKDRYLLLVILVSIPMLALAFVKPLGFDNAIYQSIALDMYRYGRIPYIGTWDQNFPGIIYIHYLAIVLFGTSDLSIRWFDTIVQVLFAGFFYHFWSRWLRPKNAALVATLYIAYYVGSGGLLLAERDVYAGMILFVSIWLVLRARDEPRKAFPWNASAGFVCGLTVVLRPTGIIPIGILGASILISNDAKWQGDRWPHTLTFFLASLIPLGAVLGYYAAIPGELETFYTTTIRWNLDLYAKSSNGIRELALQFARRAFLVPIAIFAFVKWRKLAPFFTRRLSRWEVMLYLSLSAASLLIALIMGKYFDYHFAPFFMLLMPVTALGIELLASRFSDAVQHQYALVIGVYLATFLVYIPKAPLAFGLALTTGKEPMAYTYATQYPDPNWGSGAEIATIHYFNSPANRNGSVEICSFNPNLQLHLGREHVGKYVELLPLAYRLDPGADSPPHYATYQIRWQREYIDTIRVRQPRFIVLARNTRAAYFDDVYTDLLRYIPGFDSVLQTSYRYDTAFGGYQIFRSRSDSTVQK